MAKKKSVQGVKLFAPEVRLSFPALDEPTAFEDGQEKKFRATFLYDMTNPAHKAKIKEIKAEAQRLVKEAYGNSFSLKEPPPNFKGFCFGNGNKVVDDEGNIRDGYADHFWVRTAVSVSPGVGVANRRSEPVRPGDPQFPYGGCYVNAKFNLWAQDNKYGKRINGGLIAIQFVKEGDAFGAAPVNVEDEFDALEDNSPADEGLGSGGDDDWDDDLDI